MLWFGMMDCINVKELLFTPFIFMLHYMRLMWLAFERFIIRIKGITLLPLDDSDTETASNTMLQQSLFGTTLQEIMESQTARWPDRNLPWIQVELSQQILRLNGLKTEGIFRISTSQNDINLLKFQMETWQINDPIDAHVSANLLKRWLRELREPLIPHYLYYECIAEPITPKRAQDLVLRLPTIHRLVLCYLIRLLQTFNKPEIIEQTKMDDYNLALIFAPNCLRCSNPLFVLENIHKEITFMKCLIQELDTECVQNMI